MESYFLFVFSHFLEVPWQTLLRNLNVTVFLNIAKKRRAVNQLHSPTTFEIANVSSLAVLLRSPPAGLRSSSAPARLEVYSAAAKFESGCGWPAFDKCYAGAVATKPEGPEHSPLPLPSKTISKAISKTISGF